MLFTNIYMLVCSSISVLFGLVITFAKKPPLYFQLTVFALTSQLFSRIYYLVSVLFYNGLPDIFNVGFIGYGTFMLSLALANAGQINKIADDGRKRFAWYRIVPLIIPVIEFAVAVYTFILQNSERSFRLSYLIISMIAGFAGYYNLKLLIIPDVKHGIASSIRGFNAVCLLFEIFTLAELCHDATGMTGSILYIEIPLGLLCLAVLPLLYKEVQKWKQ